MKRAVGVAALAAVLGGCAYYNAMWSAERFAAEARRLERRGREPEARVQWARAAVKAESVLARHPRSRWADDALVLRAEGLARAGSCAQAAAPIAKALATVSDAPLHERAALAAGQCALAAGKPVDAERALGEPLASEDGRLRSRAEYLAGRAAVDRHDYDAAVRHFRGSAEPAALPARAHALIAAGRIPEAASVLDTIAVTAGGEAQWAGLLDELAAADAGAASAALDRVLARGRLPFAARARLLIADGDRLLAGGAADEAAARYRAAMVAAPGSGEAGIAAVRVQRAVAGRAGSRADLDPVLAELARLDRVKEAGAGGARALLDLLTQVAAPPRTPGAGFRAAELARDSLGAPRLAGQLFLDLAAANEASLFAPKALLAGLTLLPERRDSIVEVLERVYPSSPYTRALHGEAVPTYAALEDSLAHELGVDVALTAGSPLGRGSRVDVPRTGPRGPWLDDAPGSAAARRADAERARPAARPAAERPLRERP